MTCTTVPLQHIEVTMQSTCSTCPRPVPDTAFGCSGCASALARNLDHLAAVLPELGVTVAKLDRITSGTARSDGAEAALPYKPEVAERGRAIQGELVTWARHVHAESGRPIAGNTGSAVARYLAQATQWARYRQEWPEMHAGLRGLLGSTLHLVDRPAEKVYLGPCGAALPDTGGTCSEDVLAKPGAAYGRCRECGAQHNVAEAREWLRGALNDVLMRPSEIASVLPSVGLTVTYRRIMKYVEKGQLVLHGHDTRLRPMYRVGDVIDIFVANQSAHRYGKPHELAERATTRQSEELARQAGGM